MRGVALDRLDEVADQVVAAGELDVDLTPGLLHEIAQFDQAVVGRDGPQDEREHDDADDDQRSDHDNSPRWNAGAADPMRLAQARCGSLSDCSTDEPCMPWVPWRTAEPPRAAGFPRTVRLDSARVRPGPARPVRRHGDSRGRCRRRRDRLRWLGPRSWPRPPRWLPRPAPPWLLPGATHQSSRCPRR